MLPRSQRIHQTKEFRRLYQRGRLVRGRYLTIRLTSGAGAQHRFAFVVSTKTAKLATDRNRIKRRLRTIAQTANPQSQSSFDAVVTALPPSRLASYQDLHTEFHQLLTQAHAPRRSLRH